MKAAVLEEKNKIIIKDVAELKVLDDYVKVNVKSAGLCGSDVQKILSENSFNQLKTNILGHEFSGVVSETGVDVSKFKVGDQVTGIPFIPCYTCENCEQQLHYLCKDGAGIGKTLSGAFADYVVIPEKNLVMIPENVSFNDAALTDVVAVGLHAYALNGEPKNKNILILGDGAVGLITAQIFSKYNDVTILTKNNKSNFKNIHTIDYKDINLLNSNTFDCAVECIGRRQNETIEQAIRLTKSRGVITVTGVFEPGYQGLISYRQLFFKEVILQGSNSYSISKENNEFKKALELIANHEICLDNIITNIFPLYEFNKGLSLFLNKKKSGAIKIVYNP